MAHFFFGSTSDFQQLAKQIPEDAKIIIIRLEKMPYIDQSGLFAMEDIFLSLNESSVEVRLIGLNSQPGDKFRDLSIIPSAVPERLIFDDLDSAINYKPT